MQTGHVYEAIAAVTAQMSKVGISKGRRNTQGNGYSFRGIDDVYNVLSPMLAENSLCIIPRVLHRECVERASKNGGALYYVALDVEFDFVSAKDSSKHTARTWGEAMDSSDKATNKAMSAAYKYVCFLTFAIPTEGDNDSENDTPTAELTRPIQTTPTKPSAHATPEKKPGKGFDAHFKAICEAQGMDDLFRIAGEVRADSTIDSESRKVLLDKYGEIESIFKKKEQ